jgi:flagellar motility protein MotE (MotC chaperone)
MGRSTHTAGLARGGYATVPSLIGVAFGSAVAFFIAALFATGIAQKRLLPRIQERIQAIHAENPVETGAGAPGQVPAGAAGGPQAETAQTRTERTAERDSLDALLFRIETQRGFLQEQELELTGLRGSIDSLLARFETVQNEKVARQAKLFAGMGPDDAAKVLSAMDDTSLQAILGKMNVRAASQVMAALDPRRLARLSMEGINGETLAALSEIRRESGPLLPGGNGDVGDRP